MDICKSIYKSRTTRRIKNHIHTTSQSKVMDGNAKTLLYTKKRFPTPHCRGKLTFQWFWSEFLHFHGVLGLKNTFWWPNDIKNTFSNLKLTLDDVGKRWNMIEIDIYQNSHWTAKNSHFLAVFASYFEILSPPLPARS